MDTTASVNAGDAAKPFTVRPARPDDANLVAAIMYGEPGREGVTVAGSAGRARVVGYSMIAAERKGGFTDTVIGSEAVVMQVGQQGVTVTPMLLLRIILIFGPWGVIRRIPWLLSMQRVNAPAPEGAYHIRELHTHPESRNRGLGSAMLNHAEAEARRNGHGAMSLVTHMENPARRLYERHGFRVVETRTDATYERFTGIPGRYLMVKELT